MPTVMSQNCSLLPVYFKMSHLLYLFSAKDKDTYHNITSLVFRSFNTKSFQFKQKKL